MTKHWFCLLNLNILPKKRTTSNILNANGIERSLKRLPTSPNTNTGPVPVLRPKAAQAYRAKQDELIKSGQLREAIQMDINDIRSKFGNKYDAHIQQMLESFGFSQ